MLVPLSVLEDVALQICTLSAGTLALKVSSGGLAGGWRATLACGTACPGAGARPVPRMHRRSEPYASFAFESAP